MQKKIKINRYQQLYADDIYFRPMFALYHTHKIKGGSIKND